MIDVGLLSVEGAVFHEVPKKGEVDAAGQQLDPVRSTVEAVLDDRLELFLRDRLSGSLRNAAQPVRRDDDSLSPLPDVVIAALNDGATDREPDIVHPFHPLADLLLEVQSHVSPRGLLTLVRGRCGSIPVIVIAKVEEERGLSFSTTETDGQIRVEVAIEDGLVLTNKTGVFKSALLYLDESAQLVGLVTDDQAGSAYDRPTSEYWLSDFLGCEHSNDVDVATRYWLKATKQFANIDLKDDAIARSNVLRAMSTELQSNRRNIDPQGFIRDHVPAARQDDALSRLRSNGAPTRTFAKSRAVAAKAPRMHKYVFDDGSEVRVPAGIQPDITNETVDGAEQTTLTVRGHLRRIET